MPPVPEPPTGSPHLQSSSARYIPARHRARRRKSPTESVSGQAAANRLHDGGIFARATRSEEHTSELQSLMRISYAVFCLKKKTQKTNLHMVSPTSSRH